MSDGFHLWWVEMAPRVLVLGTIVVGLAVAFLLARRVFRK